jgi:hypothetical protein
MRTMAGEIFAPIVGDRNPNKEISIVMVCCCWYGGIVAPLWQVNAGRVQNLDFYDHEFLRD